MGTVFFFLCVCVLFLTGVAVFKDKPPLGSIEATRGPHCPSFSRTPSSTGFPPPPPPPLLPSPPSPPPLLSSSLLLPAALLLRLTRAAVGASVQLVRQLSRSLWLRAPLRFPPVPRTVPMEQPPRYME